MGEHGSKKLNFAKRINAEDRKCFTSRFTLLGALL